jgi:hypothetical protein
MVVKLKIGVILLVMVATMVIGSKGVVGESESATQLLETSQRIWLSNYYENFTSDEYPKFNDQVLYENKLSNLKELEESSPSIYEVEPMSRKFYDPVMQTKCKVKKIIKSDSKGQTVGEVIYIYEHYSANKGLSDLGIGLDTPILPMKNGNTYLVFVNPVDDYINRNHYNLVSTVYGIIPVKNSIKIFEYSKVIDSFDPLPMSGLEGSDYAIENLDETKTTFISEQIKTYINDLDMMKFQINQEEFQLQRAQIEDKYAALAYSGKYMKILKEIASEALLKYYGTEVTFGN